MKIKGIATICKKTKEITICERKNGDKITQYVGDGSALYTISGLPTLDAEGIFTVLDVPRKERENYVIKRRDFPEVNFEDTDEEERKVEQGEIAISISGQTFVPIRETREMVFIESSYFSPLNDESGIINLYERITGEGKTYIVAKAGLFLQAVFFLSDIIDQEIIENLKEITRRCEFALFDKERRKCEDCGQLTIEEVETAQ